MATTVTPSEGRQSPMTVPQVDKNTAQYRDALMGLREEIGDSEDVQRVLGSRDYLHEVIGVLRRRVEVISKMIIRIVEKVDRARAPEEALKATGRGIYCDDDVVRAMPRGVGEGAKIFFFKPEPWEYTRPGFMSDDDLEKAYERRNLMACDPYSLIAHSEKESAFADDRPNGTHWKDADGKWCYATFGRWRGGRDVYVHRDGHGWGGYWWFAGLRK
jgi:hypothetical protein